VSKLVKEYESAYSDNTIFIENTSNLIPYIKIIIREEDKQLRVTLKKETAANLARSILDYCTEELLEIEGK